MKKNVFFFLTILITGVLVNCSDQSYDEPEQFLDLTSPNNYVLANSIDELEAMLLSSIEKKFEPSVYFEITKITYLNIESGVVANIEYTTGSGAESNIILMKDFPGKVICNAKKVAGFYTSKDNLKGGGITFSCTGHICCQVHANVEYDADNNVTIMYDCTCEENCSMTIDPLI